VSSRTVFERVREALLRHKNHKNREIGFRRDIEVPNEYSYIDMMIRRFHNQIGKACALAAATLILPVLAHGQAATTSTISTTPIRASLPEGGPGAVLLITTFGAMLLLSARLSSRKKPQADSK
jgi:hypothetical protein